MIINKPQGTTIKHPESWSVLSYMILKSTISARTGNIWGWIHVRIIISTGTYLRRFGSRVTL